MTCINNYYSSKDHFAADRAAGDKIIELRPEIVPGVRANRRFLGRAVRYLAAEAGVRQFLDIGTGLPSAHNTHEVSQDAAPDARVVYVDNDPIVLPTPGRCSPAPPRGRRRISAPISGTARRSWPARPRRWTSAGRWRCCS